MGRLGKQTRPEILLQGLAQSLPPAKIPGIPTNKGGPRAPSAPNAHLSPTAVLLFTSLSPFQLDHEFLRDGITVYTILYSQGLTWSDA